MFAACAGLFLDQLSEGKSCLPVYIPQGLRTSPGDYLYRSTQTLAMWVKEPMCIYTRPVMSDGAEKG